MPSAFRKQAPHTKTNSQPSPRKLFPCMHAVFNGTGLAWAGRSAMKQHIVCLTCVAHLRAEAILAHFLRGLMELCIYPPRPAPGKRGSTPRHSHQHYASKQPSQDKLRQPQPGAQHTLPGDGEGMHGTAPVPAGCTDEAIMEVIRQRDPTHQGLPNQAAVRLLLLLLHWNPAQRPTAAEALRHAYFVLPLHSNVTLACSQDRNVVGWC